MSEQEIAIQKDIELLFGFLAEDSKNKPMSNTDKQQIIQSKLSALISFPSNEQYRLDQYDLEIITLFLNNIFKGRDGLKPMEVLRHFDKSMTAQPQWIKRVLKLQKLGIIQTEDRHSEADTSIAVLLRSGLRISDNLLNRLFNEIEDEQPPALPVEPYKDNYEYLSDQFERIQLIQDIVDIKSRKYGHRRYESDNAGQQEKELKELESSIARRLQLTEKVLPFEELKAKKRLSQREELIILSLLYSEYQNLEPRRRNDPMMVINDLSRNQYEKFLNMQLCRKGGLLEKKGMLEISSNGPRESDTVIRLKETVRHNLLAERKHREQKKDTFFELIKPSVTMDNVVLTPTVSRELSLIVDVVQGSAYQHLKEWDIKGYNLCQCSTDKANNRYQGMNILFYGPPGTGKTLAAHALAHKVGKNILTFDCSKVLNMWFGVSEKNTKMIFDRYRTIAKSKKNPPVLLLNEADQFLHKRMTTVSHSTDHSYNQMQNIFLEQMEKFEGILIATTNLVENLDSAFSRRFHQKIEFKRPGTQERLKLWYIHLPEKAPLADDVDLKLLAESYPFSGGQIAVVIHNATIKAAIRDDKIYQEDFAKACEDEMKGNFDEKALVRMGF